MKLNLLFNQILVKFWFLDMTEQLVDALASICEGICHPLKIRVEKILNVPTQASALYAVTNLIRYYKKCIGKVCSLKYN